MEKTPLKTFTKERKRKKQKLMTPSSNVKDRISCLPEPLLHHILSFLDMREVVQTSFVSKTWRYVWASLSDLNFDYSLWKKKVVPRPYVKRVCTKKDECMDFVDRVLLLRYNSSSSIRKLHLSRHYCCDSGRIDTWLSFAVKQHVKEVSLEICYGETYELPYFLFNSEIEVFKLNSRTIQLQNSKFSKPHYSGKLILSSYAANDRISALPDSILHYILSFIDIKLVVKLSLLAKRWRYLWAYATDLKFPYLSYPVHRLLGKVSRKDKSLDFVDKILFLRNESNIRKLHLSSGCWFRGSGRIYTWLAYALKRNLKEVYLTINLPEHYELPNMLFDSDIEILELIGSCYGLSQVPYSMCSARRLRTLKLQSVQLPKGNANGELVFPFLENLTLSYCSHLEVNALTISAYRLKKLDVEFFRAKFLGSQSHIINFCTPKLTSLMLQSPYYKDCFQGNLSSIVSARIKASPHSGLAAQSLMKLLNRLSNVVTLEIHGLWSKATYFSWSEISWRAKDEGDQLLNRFSNLKYLKLIGLDRLSCIRSVVTFLKCTPYIETLVLEVKQGYSRHIESTKEEWAKELSLGCMFYHLRSVEVQNFAYCPNKLKLFEFLLRNAPVLETIKIIPGWEIWSNEKLQEYSKKLHSLPKASSSVTISFLP